MRALTVKLAFPALLLFCLHAAAAADAADDFVTSQMRLLTDIPEGRVDAAALSPRLRRAFSQDVIKAMRQQHDEQCGPLKSLSLLESRADAESRLLMYRADFEKTTMLYYVRATGEGLVDDLAQEPLD